MIERVKCKVTVYDNFIEIIPEVKEGKSPLKDNSSYEIRIGSITDLSHTKILENAKINFYTNVTPCYCPIEGVRAIINVYEIDTFTILYHIREASRYANWIKPELENLDSSEIPFEVTQFVKFKAAYDCLLRMYIEKAAANGGKGQLGDASYALEPRFSDISKLLKELEGLVEEWRYAVRGYCLEGRVPPKATLRGKNAKQANVTASKSDLINPINLDYSRGV